MNHFFLFRSATYLLTDIDGRKNDVCIDSVKSINSIDLFACFHHFNVSVATKIYATNRMSMALFDTCHTLDNFFFIPSCCCRRRRHCRCLVMLIDVAGAFVSLATLFKPLTVLFAFLPVSIDKTVYTHHTYKSENVIVK